MEYLLAFAFVVYKDRDGRIGSKAAVNVNLSLMTAFGGKADVGRPQKSAKRGSTFGHNQTFE